MNGADMFVSHQVCLPQVDDSPHVGAEPHGGAGVGLILPDEDGVRDGQEADQCAVLQELEDFRLVRQTPEDDSSSYLIWIQQPEHVASTCAH